MRVFLSVIMVLTLFGCATPVVTTQTVPPPKLDEYVDLPFNKFINRMFLDEVKDKYIKLDADFGYVHQAPRVGGYPAEEWVRIQIIKGATGFDNVMVPKSEADLVFDLMRGEPITIYAKTTVWHMSYKGTRQPDEIALRVTKIERRKSEKVVTFPDITGWKLVNIKNQNGVEVKTYHNDGNTITVSYIGSRPIGFWKAPIPQGQNMTTFCDKDGDGIFETILTNNPNCQ